MAKTDVDSYIGELRGIVSNEKDSDLYSLKRELNSLSESSKVFEDFEKETMHIDKDLFKQISNLSLLMKIRRLASEIKSKKQITDKLHSLHFSLNLLKNSPMTNDTSSIKNAIDAFLHDEDTKIDNIADELNDFKTKLEEIKKHHSNLLPKGLDNKIKIEAKYNPHIEQLHSIHKKQKNALISTSNLFLKLTKKHIKNLKKFK
ncbi:hypothetical protein HYX04_01005 [Candidatus Woesearchaeota archaeon]|nr:hypothetical protein [Candidatus Woesearchaeota archaeon]